ncbi:MAG: lamin tail domain-containing protein, partial [Bacteroidota bacterium]
MRFFTFGLALICCGLLTAQANIAVEVRSNVFDPADITIQVGDTVTWTNVQGVHNVNGSLDSYPNNPEGFRSGNAAPPGWVFSHVFNVPGSYDYRCDPHFGLGMVGTVTVEGAAQNDNVVITEIMYNPPESGTDSLEFIEFFNPGPGNIQMEGWTVTGITFTFPAYELPADGYVMVAVDSQAFVNNFGTSLDVFEATSGGLSNGGETVSISDASGNLIDEVTYDDEAPWPLGTDGDGASIVLCDPAEDNSIATNWQAASTEVGVEINGSMLLANPGAASDCGVAEPVVFWISEDQVINEDAGTVSFQFVAQNYPSGETIRMN